MHNFLGNIAMHIHAKYQKDRTKTEGTYLIWIKVDRQDRWTTDGSALEKLRGLC